MENLNDNKTPEERISARRHGANQPSTAAAAASERSNVMKEIKQAAAAVNRKQGELEKARNDLRRAQAAARLPRGAQTRVVRVPVNAQNGPVQITSDREGTAGTYGLEERVVRPDENDILESLRQQRQAEVGRAFIEKRAPEVEELDTEIDEIEGARAALDVLQERVGLLTGELAHLERSLGFAGISYSRNRWNDANSEYEKALDAMVSALARMSAADVVASRFATLAGKTSASRSEPYFDAPRRIRNNGNSYPVDFRGEVIPDAHRRAVALLHGELEQLGVEI